LDIYTVFYGIYFGSKSSGSSVLAFFIALTSSSSSAFLYSFLAGDSASNSFFFFSQASFLASLCFSFSVILCTTSFSSSLPIFTESLFFAPLGAFFGNSYSFSNFIFLFLSAILSLSSASSCSRDFTLPSSIAYSYSSAFSLSYFSLAFNFFSVSFYSIMLEAKFLRVLLL